MKILVTGVAGFIGMSLTIKLIKLGHDVIGIDNISKLYDSSLKENRIKNIYKFCPNFQFSKISLTDNSNLKKVFEVNKFDCVINLAAQAGVRYSIQHPKTYIDSNIYGFLNILEGCRHNKIKHLIYASSSSVYGLNVNVPSSEENNTDYPMSLYAATKKSNELMAHAYSNLYNIQTTGLRFFTVYGPWGRPDMAPFIFADALNKGEEIKLFNNGNMFRDFTYIDDVTESIIKLIENPYAKSANFDPKSTDVSYSSSNFRIFNIGNSNPVSIKVFLKELEFAFGKKSVKKLYPMQLGEVHKTYADCSKLENYIKFTPQTSLSLGVKKFVCWFKKYYNIR